MSPIEETRKRLMTVAQKTYTAEGERAAMRCALADASGLLDQFARQVANENRGRRGTGAATKRGALLAAMVKRCADQVWEMREEIHRHDPTTPQPLAAKGE